MPKDFILYALFGGHNFFRCRRRQMKVANYGSADLVGWYVRQIKNKVVPLLHGFNKAFTCHPSRCAYRQLRGCEF